MHRFIYHVTPHNIFVSYFLCLAYLDRGSFEAVTSRPPLAAHHGLALDALERRVDTSPQLSGVCSLQSSASGQHNTTLCNPLSCSDAHASAKDIEFCGTYRIHHLRGPGSLHDAAIMLLFFDIQGVYTYHHT